MVMEDLGLVGMDFKEETEVSQVLSMGPIRVDENSIPKSRVLNSSGTHQEISIGVVRRGKEDDTVQKVRSSANHPRCEDDVAHGARCAFLQPMAFREQVRSSGALIVKEKEDLKIFFAREGDQRNNSSRSASCDGVEKSKVVDICKSLDMPDTQEKVGLEKSNGSTGLMVPDSPFD